jgi:hypothetical protein
MSNFSNADVARMINDLRFQCFPYVSDEEKSKIFFNLLCTPLNSATIQSIGVAIQSNHWFKLVELMKVLKKHKKIQTLDHRKDYEMIKGLYFGEENEAFANQLLTSLHEFTIETDTDKVLWNAVMNLLYSATCHQDKVAALFLLATK